VIFGELVQLIQDLQCFVSPTCKPVRVPELRYKEGAALGKSDSFLDFYDRLSMISLLFVSLPEPKVRECVVGIQLKRIGELFDCLVVAPCEVQSQS